MSVKTALQRLPSHRSACDTNCPYAQKAKVGLPSARTRSCSGPPVPRRPRKLWIPTPGSWCATPTFSRSRACSATWKS